MGELELMVLALCPYNRQRIGSHDPQPCHCGEPQCIGVIGGKTQTDIAAMDDIVLDGKIVTL